MMKRIFDLLVSSVILLLCIPIFIFIGCNVKINLGSPIFFRQQRPGKDGVPFEMIKFRTMREAVDNDSKTLPDRERMTSFGTFLRSTSMDELPELWNVVKGEMSLVGPRPLLMEYLPLYSLFQLRRHEVRPGVTGWAQVNGRNALSWKKRFELDVWYVDNFSMWLDFKILLLTVKKVLIRDGINAQGEATVSKFTGNNS